MEKKLWTKFPQEYVLQVKTALREQFGKLLHQAQFYFDGRIESQMITLKVGYLEAGRLKQNNFSLRFPYDSHKQDTKAMINQGLDVLATVMDDFIASEESMDLPRTWKKLSVRGFAYELEYSTVNSDLEAAADEILKLAQVASSDDEDASEDLDNQEDMEVLRHLRETNRLH